MKQSRRLCIFGMALPRCSIACMPQPQWHVRKPKASFLVVEATSYAFIVLAFLLAKSGRSRLIAPAIAAFSASPPLPEYSFSKGAPMPRTSKAITATETHFGTVILISPQSFSHGVRLQVYKFFVISKFRYNYPNGKL